MLLVDVDSKIPNLALMKLSTYHKARGDLVSFVRMGKRETVDLFFHDPEKVYASVIFDLSMGRLNDVLSVFPRAIVGGPGYDPTVCLDHEIEQQIPDYSLYPEYKDSVGYVTRGCARSCHFCKVPIMEPGGIRFIQWPDRFFNVGICRILDDNILLMPDVFMKVACWAIENDVTVQFDNLDIRLVDPQIAAKLKAMRHKNRCLHFSFDFTRIEPAVRKGVGILLEAGFIARKLRFYIYCQDEEQIPDAQYRFGVLREIGCEPFLMVNPNYMTDRLRKIRRRGICPAIYRGLTVPEVFA